MNIQPISSRYDLAFGTSGCRATETLFDRSVRIGRERGLLAKPLSENSQRTIINQIKDIYGEVIDSKLLRLDYIGIKNGEENRYCRSAYSYKNAEGNVVKHIGYRENSDHLADSFGIAFSSECLPNDSRIAKFYDSFTHEMVEVKYYPAYKEGVIDTGLAWKINNGEIEASMANHF